MNTTAAPRIAACTLLAIAVLLAAARASAADLRRNFDITAGSAVARLNQWAEQAGVALIGDFEKITGLTTHAVKGNYTPEAALRMMTHGTGIACTYTHPKVVWCSLEARASKKNRKAEPPVPKSADHSSSVQTVLVTGTHIRGISPTGARGMTLSAADIASSGLATVSDVLRTLPQNFDGGPTEDTMIIGRETRTNAGRGTALNLRGLGPAETLVLVNGRRLAPGGTEGAFTDIAAVPLIAVGRIDVLPDSGSALYGSDAIGGVVDIVFDRERVGFENQAKGGLASRDGPGEVQLGQLYGAHWQGGSVLLAAEYYGRDRLPAAARAQAHSDLRPFGGDNFDYAQSNPGTLFAGGIAWAIPRDQDGSALEPADLVPGANLSDRFNGADMHPRQRRVSGLASIQQDVGPSVRIYADALISRRESEQRAPGIRVNLPVTSSNPFYVNPLGGTEPVLVGYDFTKDLGASLTKAVTATSNVALGGTLDLAGGWRISSYLAQAREGLEAIAHNQVNVGELMAALLDPDPLTAFNPFGDGSHTHTGTLERIRSTGHFDMRSTLRSLNVAADGGLGEWPGGTMKVALGAEYRHHGFESRTGTGETSTRTPQLNRDVKAAFAELLVPVLQSSQRVPGARELALSLAARYEDHGDISNTLSPKAGLTWSPAQDFIVRGTWTTAFRAPNLADLYEGENRSAIVSLPDPASPAMFSRTLVWVGKNASLSPESSRSWTLGFELGSPRLAGWSLAATYFDIRLRKQFTELRVTPEALSDPASAERILRSPDERDRAEVCGRSAFIGNPTDCLKAPIDALLDARLRNSSILSTNGIDLSVKRTFDTAAGRFKGELEGAYVMRYAVQGSRTAPLVEKVDTQNNVLRLRLRSALDWERGPAGARVQLNYDGGYRDVQSAPHRSVDPWATWDLRLFWDVSQRERGANADSRLALSVQNVFDEDPPFLNNPLGLGYDAENADLLGRVLSLQLTTRW